MTTAQQLSSEIFDADTLTPDAAGELALPGWLRIDCPTAGRTAQTSASTVQSGLGANTARAISRDGANWALLAEAPAINLINDQADLDTWGKSGTPVIASAVAPDGSTSNLSVEDDDGAAAEDIFENFAGIDIVNASALSAWMRVTDGVPTASSRIFVNDGSGLVIDTGVAEDSAFVLRSVTDVAISAASDVVIIPRRAAVDVGKLLIWGIQLEVGEYPTSFIGADSINFTRAADVLRAAPEVIAPGGCYHIVLRYRPHYSESEQAVDHNLIYFDESNRLFLRQVDAKLVLLVDGAELASAALTFSRYQDLTITIENSATQRRLLVAGASTGNGDTTGAPAAAIALPLGWAFLLGGSSGSEEGAELVGLDFHDLSSFTMQQLADVRVLVQMDDDTANRKFRDLMADFAEGAGRYRDVCFAIRSALDLDTASGEQLDIVGRVVDLAREGFTDSRYRVFLGIQILLLLSSAREDANWTGTIQNIVTICREFAGPGAGQIVYRGSPPYAYRVDVPDLVLSEADLLARFLTTANYAGVDGQLVVILAADSLYDSKSVGVTGAGIYDSASVVVAGAAIYSTVISTS